MKEKTLENGDGERERKRERERERERDGKTVRYGQIVSDGN